MKVGFEECDDAPNDLTGKCKSDCTGPEIGWVCEGGSSTTPSDCYVDCGDGLIILDEDCDDSNEIDGDGCSSDCTFEDYWLCTGQPSDCVPIC